MTLKWDRYYRHLHYAIAALSWYRILRSSGIPTRSLPFSFFLFTRQALSSNWFPWNKCLGFEEHGNDWRMALVLFAWLGFIWLFFFFSFHFCLFGLFGFYLLVFCSKKECNPLSLAQTHCDWQVKEAARFYFRRPSYVVSMVTRSRHIYVCCRPFYIPVIFSCFHYLSGPWAWIDVHYCASIQSAAVRFVAKLLASYVMTSLTHATRPNADADAKTKTKTKKTPLLSLDSLDFDSYVRLSFSILTRFEKENSSNKRRRNE